VSHHHKLGQLDGVAKPSQWPLGLVWQSLNLFLFFVIWDNPTIRNGHVSCSDTPRLLIDGGQTTLI